MEPLEILKNRESGIRPTSSEDFRTIQTGVVTVSGSESSLSAARMYFTSLLKQKCAGRFADRSAPLPLRRFGAIYVEALQGAESEDVDSPKLPSSSHKRFGRGRSRTLGVGNNLVVLISPRPSGNPEVRMGTPIAESGAGAPDLSNTACYLLVDGSLEFEWAMPNFVMDGWALTDCSVARKGTELALITCIRRRGIGGPAGLALKGANGTEICLESHCGGYLSPESNVG
jgi:hypothetical protein